MKIGDQVLVWQCHTQRYSVPAFGGAKRSIKKMVVTAQYVINLSRTEDVEGEITWVGTLPGGEEYFLVGMTWVQVGDYPGLPQQESMAHAILQTHKPSDGWQITVDHPRQPSVPFTLNDFAMIGHCTLLGHDRYYAKAWGCINCKLPARTAEQAKPKK